MTIDQALAELLLQLEVKHRIVQNYSAEALQLGIEALKRVKVRRTSYASCTPDLLPGETST